MDIVISPELEPQVFMYLDDVNIATTSFDDNLNAFRAVPESLQAAGLTIKATKCDFCRSSLKYIGFIVDKEGLRTDPTKVSAIAGLFSTSYFYGC